MQQLECSRLTEALSQKYPTNPNTQESVLNSINKTTKDTNSISKCIASVTPLGT